MPNKYRAQDAVLSFASSNINVGIIQEVSVEVEKETGQLRGFGSVMRQDEQQTAVDVSVSAEFMAFTEEGLRELIGMETTTVDGNDEYTIQDTSDIPTFDIIGEFNPVDDTATKTDATISEAYFETVPISGSREDWIGLELDGTAETMNFDNKT